MHGIQGRPSRFSLCFLLLVLFLNRGAWVFQVFNEVVDPSIKTYELALLAVADDITKSRKMFAKYLGSELAQSEPSEQKWVYLHAMLAFERTTSKQQWKYAIKLVEKMKKENGSERHAS